MMIQGEVDSMCVKFKKIVVLGMICNSIIGREHIPFSGGHFIETCLRLCREMGNTLKSVSSSGLEKSIVYWLNRSHQTLASFRGNPRIALFD